MHMGQGFKDAYGPGGQGCIWARGSGMHMGQGFRDAYGPGGQGTSAGPPPMATMITYVVMWSIHVYVSVSCHLVTESCMPGRASIEMKRFDLVL